MIAQGKYLLSTMSSNRIRDVLQVNMVGIDASALDYFESMLLDAGSLDLESLSENMAPFIESYGLASDNTQALAICEVIYKQLSQVGLKSNATICEDTPQLLEKVIILSEVAKSQVSKAEQEAIDTLWGFDKVRSKRNTAMESVDTISMKTERKAAKEQKKFLSELESKFTGEDESNEISMMTLPDLSGNSREKDIHVHNFGITFGGQILLENAHLKLVFGRRYGLIGRNGIGKTTLLRHMANFDIEGFPRFVMDSVAILCLLCVHDNTYMFAFCCSTNRRTI